MKPPRFWQGEPGIAAALLAPLALWYDRQGQRRRSDTLPHRVPVPVICIGNLTVGGGGKTPLALAIGERLKARGVNAWFLSRGYGGTLAGPVTADASHTAAQVGDEPLLLARLLPTVVSRDRKAGAAFILGQGGQAIVMDDGFQNPSLAKTLSLLAVDGPAGFGNGRVMPAGPLRENLAGGLARADALVIIGPKSERLELPEDKPVLSARLHPSMRLAGQRVLAFCGIANPAKFRATLEGLGASVAQQVNFSDHHAYSRGEVKRLLARAASQNALPVTTAKDAVRLPDDLRTCVRVIDVTLVFDDPAGIDALLDKALARR